MSRSWSVKDLQRSSSVGQLNQSDLVTRLYASSPIIVQTSPTVYASDDGDWTRTESLPSVTSFAWGPKSAISSLSKSILPTAVLQVENQSYDTSIYQIEFPNRRQVTAVSLTSDWSRHGEEELKSSYGIAKDNDHNGHSTSNIVSGLLFSSNVITASKGDSLEIHKSDSGIIYTEIVPYSTERENESDSSSLSRVDIPFSSGSDTFSSQWGPFPSESESVSPEITPILQTPNSVPLESSIFIDQRKSNSDRLVGHYSLASSSKIDPYLTSYFSNLLATLYCDSDTITITPSLTLSIQPSNYLFVPEEKSLLLSKSPEETTQVIPDDLIASFYLSNFAPNHFESQTISIGIKNPTELSDFVPSRFNDITDSSSLVYTIKESQHTHISPKPSFRPNDSRLNSELSYSKTTGFSFKSILVSTSRSPTMTQLTPSQTSSLRMLNFPSSPLTAVSSAPLSKITLTTTQSLETSSMAILSYSETVSTSGVFTLNSVTATPFVKSSVSTVSGQSAPSAMSVSASIISEKTTLIPSSQAKVPMDPGYPVPSSTSFDQLSFKTRSIVDGLPETDHSFYISYPKSSLHSFDQSSVNSASPTVRTSILATPTFSPSITPTASVIGGGTGNTTVIPPGKVNTDKDDGFMSGSTPIIVGSACGVFVVGVVIILALVCALRRKRKNKTLKRDPRVDDLWVDTGRGDDRLPPPSMNNCLGSYDNQVPVDSDQVYQATHGYVSKQDGYLSFAIGDLIHITEVSDNDWCRGVAIKDGTTGWFPSHYVEEIKEFETRKVDELKAPIEEAQMDVHGQLSSFQIRKGEHEDAKPLVKENLAVHGNLEVKDIPGDVASWVKMATSVSMTSLRSIDTIGANSTINDYSSVKGVHFRAIYSYKPVCKGEMSLKEGELVICKERDKNGWMLGIKPRTKEEGWFPAVYVDGVSSEDAALREDDMPATYDVLDSNKLHNVSQPWTGIEHKAIKSYTSNVQGDLNFQSDEVIIVFQTLANGWWFGSIDKRSGWFPGAYVQMTVDESENIRGVDMNNMENTSVSPNTASPIQNDSETESTKELLLSEFTPIQKSSLSRLKSENGQHSELSYLFSESATNSPRDSIASSINSENDLKPLVTPKHVTLEGRFKKAIRPNRKAPAPPSSSLVFKSKDSSHSDGTSSLRRPVRRAPPPPTKANHKGDNYSKNTPPINAQDTSGAPLFKRPIYLINGKRPKLIKLSPDIFDEKSLNPVIRPATRGLAPVLKMQNSKSPVSPIQFNGSPTAYDASKMMKNIHDVERRERSRPTTPLYFRLAEQRLSSASRASYGSTDDQPTNSSVIGGQDVTNGLSRSSTPTILQGPGSRRNKTLTTVPPPLVPTFNNIDGDNFIFPFPPINHNPDHIPAPPPINSSPDNMPPPPLDYNPDKFHEDTSQNTTENFPLTEKGNQNMECQMNENINPISSIEVLSESIESKVASAEMSSNQHQQPAFRRMSSNQKTAPSTLPKPRRHNNKSPPCTIPSETRQQTNVIENNSAASGMPEPLCFQRRPSEVSQTGNGHSLIRESLAVIPGKVSEIVHHLNSLSPQSAFPPLQDNTELSLIIPGRKQSGVGLHTPNNISVTSPTDFQNEHDSSYDSPFTSPQGGLKDIPQDLSSINQDILQKNTFMPITDDLEQIEDRVSTFRSLPRPSRKPSKDSMALSLATEAHNYSSIKSDHNFSFFKPPSDFADRVTEL